MSSCTLCGLTTPDNPVTSESVEGKFCCQGCLEVYDTLGDVDIEEVGAKDIVEDNSEVEEGEAEEIFLSVDGMHCSTCEMFLEATALKNEGVIDAKASYASDMVKVTYDPEKISKTEIKDIVTGVGYRARDPGENGEKNGKETLLRLGIGAHLGMMVMFWYLIFLYPKYYGWTDASWEALDPGPAGISSFIHLWILTTAILFVTGFPILRGAYVSIRSRQPNMDLLIALAAVNAYVFSTIIMLIGGSEVYFDITVVIVLVVTLGNYYENRIKSKTSDIITRFTEEQVDEARLRTEDGTKNVEIDELSESDEVVVKPGERVPIDGEITEGTGSVDESLVTGESIPVRKTQGDKVIGGTLVTDNALVIEVSDGAESTLDRLVTLLWEIQSSKPGAQRLADKLAAVFVPLVIVLAFLTFGVRIITGTGFVPSILTGLTVLVVSCPCALGLATPLAVASGVRAGLKDGIVVKHSSVFESASETDVVAFDKTGTLTTGEMKVNSVLGDEKSLKLASAVEQFSNHPIADAITRYGDIPDSKVSEFEEFPGKGVSAEVDGDEVVVGDFTLFEERDWTISDEIRKRAKAARSNVNVPTVVGWGGEARSVIVVGDQPKDEWMDVVEKLGSQGKKVAVITGDDESAAERFEEHPDIEYVFAGVPPEAKAEIIERLRKEGTTAMVGDGNNDAPALASADLGIALNTGTALATDAADVVITTKDLESLPRVFDITSKTKSRIRQNIGWAFLYNAIAIPIAVAGLINPLFAAVAMATSSLFVVANSSRSFDGFSIRRRIRPSRVLGKSSNR